MVIIWNKEIQWEPSCWIFNP